MEIVPVFGLVLLAFVAVVFAALWQKERTANTSADQLAKVQVDQIKQASEQQLAQMREQLEYSRRQLKDEQDLRRKEVDVAQKERDLARDGENKVLQKLAPVSENLDKMQKKITELEEQRKLQHGSLEHLLKQTQDGEKELRKITDKLAGTLTKGQTRGAWGEMQLKRLMEDAGLIEHVDFDMQFSAEIDGSHLRPDAVLHLPGGKSIPIDSKAPFDSYYAATSIPDTADEQEISRKNILLQEHAKALRGHIKALSDKKYWEALDISPDFVVAFIPSESLLSGALRVDPSILEYAFKMRVALASPVTLWSILKSVAYAWNQEEKVEEVAQILEIAKELYQNVHVVANHSAELAKHLDKTVDSYNKFASTLERKVVTSGRKLEKLDPSKVIVSPEQIEKQTREFTKDELVSSITA